MDGLGARHQRALHRSMLQWLRIERGRAIKPWKEVRSVKKFGIRETETVRTAAALYACSECPMCCLFGIGCNPA